MNQILMHRQVPRLSTYITLTPSIDVQLITCGIYTLSFPQSVPDDTCGHTKDTHGKKTWPDYVHRSNESCREMLYSCRVHSTRRCSLRYHRKTLKREAPSNMPTYHAVYELGLNIHFRKDRNASYARIF